MMDEPFDDIDRAILNTLQRGFPVSEWPYRDAARELGIEEDQLIARLHRLLHEQVLTRFGPLYQVERAGGRFVLAAMEVPEARIDEVAALLNEMPQIAHNYLRTHRLNMWFVIAVDAPEKLAPAIARIEDATGIEVHAMPKLREYFVGLHLAV